MKKVFKEIENALAKREWRISSDEWLEIVNLFSSKKNVKKFNKQDMMLKVITVINSGQI